MRALLLAGAPLASHAGSSGLLPLDRDTDARLRRVLRLRDGAELRVTDGAGLFAHATLLAEGLQLAAVECAPAEAAPALALHCGWIKGERMDWMVEKAVEVGAASITPLASDHAVVRLEAKRAEKRRERLQAVADAALEQCGRAQRCSITVESSLRALCAAGTPLLMADEAGGVDLFAAVTTLPTPLPSTVGLVVGPEGGWSLEERAQLRAAGAVAVSLGPAILRAETAAIALILQTRMALDAASRGLVKNR